MTDRSPWSLVFGDVMTGELLGRVPVNQVQFSTMLNTSGALSGQINMADPRVQQATANLGGGDGGLLEAGRTTVYVDYAGTLLWGGVLMTTSFDTTQGQPVLQVGAVDWWGWIGNQRVVSWTNDSAATQLAYTNVDVLAIVEDLFNRAQADNGGNVGISVPSTESGALCTVTFEQSQAIILGQAVQQLSQQAGVYGFDYAINVAYNGAYDPTKAVSKTNQPILKLLELGYPRLGRVSSSDGLVFRAGGKGSMGYTWPVDATSSGLKVIGIGAGQGSAATTATSTVGGSLMSIQSYQPAIDGGWPLTEQVVNRSDITSQAILDAVTISQLAAVAYPVPTPTFVQNVDHSTPALGEWMVGDDCRAIVNPDPWFTSGLDTTMRIGGHTFNIADQGVSSVQIALVVPPLLS